MEILVTGGSGFIGKAFIKSYRKVFDIVAPSHEEMDLTDARSVDAFFKGHKFDAVLHLAGMGETGKSAVLEADNVIMFKNIQYVAIRNGVKKLITVGEGVDFDRSQQIRTRQVHDHSARRQRQDLDGAPHFQRVRHGRRTVAPNQ